MEAYMRLYNEVLKYEKDYFMDIPYLSFSFKMRLFWTDGILVTLCLYNA